MEMLLGRVPQGAVIPVREERAQGNGWGNGIHLDKELSFFSLAASLSQACPRPVWSPRTLSLGEGATEELHSQESGWPETSSFAVRTASPGSSAAHPDNARKTEGSAHMMQKAAV